MKYKGLLMWLNSHKKHLISNEEYAMAEVIDDAIEIINLHTPEKPKLESYGSSYAIFCPNCNEEIGKSKCEVLSETEGVENIYLNLIFVSHDLT